MRRALFHERLLESAAGKIIKGLALGFSRAFGSKTECLICFLYTNCSNSWMPLSIAWAQQTQEASVLVAKKHWSSDKKIWVWDGHNKNTWARTPFQMHTKTLGFLQVHSTCLNPYRLYANTVTNTHRERAYFLWPSKFICQSPTSTYIQSLLIICVDSSLKTFHSSVYVLSE